MLGFIIGCQAHAQHIEIFLISRRCRLWASVKRQNRNGQLADAIEFSNALFSQGADNKICAGLECLDISGFSRDCRFGVDGDDVGS